MNENLTQILKMGFDGLQNEIHTALPARVIKFNPSDNTVQVELMINQLSKNGKTLIIPPLDDVPVQFFRGGDFVITTPISPGDEGLCVFAERCIDGWFESSNKKAPLDFRLHDYSDGFFLTGFSSKPNAVKNVDLDGVCIRTLDKSTFIRLTKGKIYIKGDIEQVGNYKQQGNYDQQGNYNQKGSFRQTEGNSQSSGTITANEVIADGVNLKTHTHGGDSGGTTTPPN
ncbi:Gp138 family membrane-puncturing spike protein [Campylobacter mucosalis]|uniref:Gp138 family membrane-puncturing spike protein n=1 Tax=Campylobacter mucosalis TaxID=202 RepID=UPI0014705DE9|nr:Gp138 family membrane-puncturing spike protein [Campylobacter mucosalis]